jgi:DNA-binding winged helix-turn-helix (wHTH) protein
MNRDLNKLITPEFRLGSWTVSPQTNRLASRRRTIRLEPKIMEVLICLALRAGQVVAKDQLMQDVWINTYVTADSIKRCVSILRKVLEDDARNPQIIETIPKRGYRLAVPIFRLAKRAKSLLPATPTRATRKERERIEQATARLSEKRTGPNPAGSLLCAN